MNTKHARHRLLAAPLLALMASGCVDMAPRHERPAPPAHADAGQDGRRTAELSWRDAYTDQRLGKVIEISLAQNRDLRVATLSVERARAQYQIQQASGQPGLGLGLNAARGKESERQFSASVGLAAYELDFFGRVRNLSELALQDFLMREESRRSAQISLIAETAHAWLALAADLQRRALAERTLDNRLQSYRLTRVRVDLGAAGELPLAQAQSAVELARNEVIAHTAQIAQSRHALDLIAGVPVPETLLPRADADWSTELMQLPPAPAAVSSYVLQRRPDVLAAEHALQGANANIGAVRAARFPRITLTGSTGSAGSELSSLFKRGVWSYGAALAFPLLDGGASRAGVRVAEVERDMALAQYDKAIQQAFRDVADALSVSDTLAARAQTQRSLLESARRQLALAEVQYRVGGSSQLELLDAQRTLYEAESSTITLQQTIQTSRITLYKALGGGWDNT